MPRFRTPGAPHALVALLAAVAAAVAVGFAASPLPRITPDSATYLTGAERLAHDGRFESCEGPVTLFAPGYSAAMAPLVALGVGAPDAARAVNVLATLALVLGAAALAGAAQLTLRIRAIVGVAVALSFVTLRNGALAWSEPLFCALLGALLVVVVNGGRGLAIRVSTRVLIALLASWALLLTRHSGLFVLPALLLAAWLGSAGVGRRALRVAGFAAGVLAVPALWWLRNIDVGVGPFGSRSQSRFSAVEVLRQFPDGLSSLTLPNHLPLAVRLAVLAPLILAAMLAWRRTARAPRPRLVVSVLWTVVVGYTGAVTVAAMRTVVDPIDTRLLSPIFVPAAVLVAVGIAGPARTRARPGLERILSAGVVGVVAFMAVLAPGVVWRGHAAVRDIESIPDDVSCAEWPERYSTPAAIRLSRDRG